MVVKREFWSGFSVRLRRAEAQGLAPGWEADGNSCHWGWEMMRRWCKPGHGRELILTCDWFLEGTHFLRDKHPADSVGWKCLARAVSDVGAMGGMPNASC